MYGKFSLVLVVLVAAFASVQGLKDKEDRNAIRKKCEADNNLDFTKDELWDLWDTQGWCQDEGTQKVSECILLAYDAWVDGHPDFTAAENKWEQGSEKYEAAKKCFDSVEELEPHLKGCELLNCCKRENLGEKKKRDRRSIFNF